MQYCTGEQNPNCQITKFASNKRRNPFGFAGGGICLCREPKTCSRALGKTWCVRRRRRRRARSSWPMKKTVGSGTYDSYTARERERERESAKAVKQLQRSTKKKEGRNLKQAYQFIRAKPETMHSHICRPNKQQPEHQGEGEGEGMEAVLDRAWELHDKISDAIHSVCRDHFVAARSQAAVNNGRHMKGRSVNVNVEQRCRQELDLFSETRSLNAIRSALEVLENQLYLLHTLEHQQRIEREAALMRLEESRIMLLKKLREHRGRELNVIQEAMAFAGDKDDAENIGLCSNVAKCYATNEIDKSKLCKENANKNVNVITKCYNGLNCLLSTSIEGIKNSEHLFKLAGAVAKVALIAASMLTVMQFQLKRKTKDIDCSRDAAPRNALHLKKHRVSAGLGTLDVLHGRG